MRFDRIRLVNFKPYGDADLGFVSGVTVIHGLNGSGKSSLLEACFFALYGSKALDGTLAEVITNGEDETEVTLWFSHDGVSYRVERRLRAYDDRVDHDCVLESTDGDVTRDGATAVRRFVTDLLRMDADAFVNCAYVRQGEVNALINATPSQRQAVIDDLLQLGTLETYRERAGEARLGVEDVLNAKRAVIDEKEAQIEAKTDANLHERLNGLESRLSETTEQIDRYETQREQARETRANAAETLATYEEKRDELTAVESTIEEIETAIRETERKRSEHREAIREAREQITEAESAIKKRLADAGLEAATEEAITARRGELEEQEATTREALEERRVNAEAFRNQASNLAEKADDLRARATEAAETADEFEAAAEAAETEAATHESTKAEREAEIETLCAQFEATDYERETVETTRETLRDQRGEVRERIAGIETELKNARERVKDATALLEAGKCPACGQPVAGSPHTTGIEADRERVAELETTLREARERAADLDERVETVDALVEATARIDALETETDRLEERAEREREKAATKRESAAEARERAETLRDEAAETDSVATKKRAEAESAADRVSELEATLESLDDTRERVEAIADRVDRIDEREAAIDQRREKRESLKAVNDERRDRLADKRARRDELREAVDAAAIESAREKKTQATKYLEQVQAELEQLDEKQAELQNAIGSVRGEITALETLRDERDALAETVESLASVHDETSELETMYGDLRAELRQRNVRELERTLNETFELVYGNDAYSHIELDGEYALTVYQKDGEALAPDQLSGGERALFNLSLRCAIYRLLAEGVEGATPTPPLILDEPTVFLDAGHVSRLIDLVEEMRGFGVTQIVIVSHDDELVGAADELVTVEKDPRTNRSSVTRERAASTDVASLADD